MSSSIVIISGNLTTTPLITYLLPLYSTAVFQLLQFLIHLIQPFLVPICFVSAWSIVALTLWSLWTATQDALTRSRQMHRIPCANCQFFTSDYHLKCTVHPTEALTEEAINCMDYEPNRSIGQVYETSYR